VTRGGKSTFLGMPLLTVGRPLHLLVKSV